MSTTQRPPKSVDPGDAPEESRELARTEIYDVLSNERRTMVLELLAEEDSRELGELAELIAAEETGERPPPRKKRTSVYVTLHQSHLPKLAELSIVEYDDREKVVSLGARASSVLAQRRGEATEPTPSEDRAGWSPAYFVLVVSGLALAGASAVGVPVLDGASAGAYALGTLFVLLVVLAIDLGRDTFATGLLENLLR